MKVLYIPVLSLIFNDELEGIENNPIPASILLSSKLSTILLIRISDISFFSKNSFEIYHGIPVSIVGINLDPFFPSIIDPGPYDKTN